MRTSGEWLGCLRKIMSRNKIAGQWTKYLKKEMSRDDIAAYGTYKWNRK